MPSARDVPVQWFRARARLEYPRALPARPVNHSQPGPALAERPAVTSGDRAN